MNDEKFELTISDLAGSGTYYADIADELRARDTAQREALARVEETALEAASLAQRRLEERDAVLEQLAQLQAEMPDLHANMTKALDLLEVLTSAKYTDRAFVEAVDEADEMLERLRGKVVLEGLAEQQEARGAAGAPVDWSSPKTVRHLIAQLQTLEPETEIVSLLRMTKDLGPGREVRQVPVTMSWERMNGPWLAPFESEHRKVLAFWLNGEHKAVPAAAQGDEATGTVRVTADWLKKVHRDLDACQ
ncbi:hypothetical protein [Pseudomonas oryzihabitans]|uniref:hypothetical protein n=1 Tax=Pseudomonas oryzihabitans TaxID=47885 RepID=UPI00119CC524|nr:hypothetical protein [Pseudomonas oryzihabitans]